MADLVARIQRRPLAQRRRAVIKDAQVLQQELESVDRQLQKALELYTKGRLDEDQLDAMNGRLRQRRCAVKDQLDALQGPLKIDFRVNTERLRAFLKQMDEWMREGDPVRRKTLLRNVYQEIRLWPKSGRNPGRARYSSPPTWRSLHALLWCPRRDWVGVDNGVSRGTGRLVTDLSGASPRDACLVLLRSKVSERQRDNRVQGFEPVLQP